MLSCPRPAGRPGRLGIGQSELSRGPPLAPAERLPGDRRLDVSIWSDSRTPRPERDHHRGIEESGLLPARDPPLRLGLDSRPRGRASRPSPNTVLGLRLLLYLGFYRDAHRIASRQLAKSGISELAGWLRYVQCMSSYCIDPENWGVNSVAGLSEISGVADDPHLRLAFAALFCSVRLRGDGSPPVKRKSYEELVRATIAAIEGITCVVAQGRACLWHG